MPKPLRPAAQLRVGPRCAPAVAARGDAIDDPRQHGADDEDDTRRR